MTIQPVVVRRSSAFDVPAARVWHLLQRPDTFLFVVRGVMGAPAVGRADVDFQPGATVSGWLWLFHLVPMHRHHITIVEVDPTLRLLRTHERGGLLRAWNHTLHVRPDGAARCIYTDTIEIDAGWLTPVAASVARVLFWYRHRRWRRLLQR